MLEELEEFLRDLKDYGCREPRIESILLVGSFARGTNHPGSDIDLVIISSGKKAMLEDPSFIHQFGEVQRQQVEFYRACTSLRVWYEDGREVEFGLVEASWIAEPLDPGTRGVLEDGYRVIFDRHQLQEGADRFGERLL